MEKQSIRLSFADNKVLPELFGEDDRNLQKIEHTLDVEIASRGETLRISGTPRNVAIGKAVIRTLYDKLHRGDDVSDTELDAMIRMLSHSIDNATVDEGDETVRGKPAKGKGKPAAAKPQKMSSSKPSQHSKGGEGTIHTIKKTIVPFSPTQAVYMQALLSSELTFGAGPAGTGKTYLAVAAAVSRFIDGKVDRIILSRPAVEAGERLGFLPGDLKEKVDPYLRPLYDALYDMLPPERVIRLMETGQIEIAPLAFMRGRTLRNAYIILDEAQNTTAAQMKMFLTRLGEGSQMAITGDLSQTDLPKGVRSGFRDALEKLSDIPGIKVAKFSAPDVIRHPLTAKIVAAYEKFEDEAKWSSKD